MNSQTQTDRETHTIHMEPRQKCTNTWSKTANTYPEHSTTSTHMLTYTCTRMCAHTHTQKHTHIIEWYIRIFINLLESLIIVNDFPLTSIGLDDSSIV